jgi:hypothetical protein
LADDERIRLAGRASGEGIQLGLNRIHERVVLDQDARTFYVG